MCHFIDSSLADVEAVEKLASKKKVEKTRGEEAEQHVVRM